MSLQQPQKYVYIGGFLSDSGKEQLLKEFPTIHPKVFADHVTFIFKPSDEEAGKFNLGEIIDIKVVGEISDSKGQAVLIELPKTYKNLSANAHPHITISTAENVPPNYSNDLIGSDASRRTKTLDLKVKIGAFTGSGYEFSKRIPAEPKSVSLILLPTRPQIDTIIAIFILKQFGEKMYPGIIKAALDIMPIIPEGQNFGTLLDEGKLALDMGGGPLDHHNQKGDVTLSILVAESLGLQDHPALQKLLAFAQRDDVEGKGTISADALDKAFGLSGLLATMNKVHQKHPEYVIQSILPLIDAHYQEEVKRTELMPAEVKEKLASGAAEAFEVRQRDKKLNVIIVKSDNMSLPGYLRSQIGGRYDVVVQCTSIGHVNVLTRPTKHVDLRSLVALIRTEELNNRGNTKDLDIQYLARVGRIEEVPNWYYDTATNSIQNGGANPKNVEPTKIEAFSLRKLVELGLSERLWSPMADRRQS